MQVPYIVDVMKPTLLCAFPRLAASFRQEFEYCLAMRVQGSSLSPEF